MKMILIIMISLITATPIVIMMIMVAMILKKIKFTIRNFLRMLQYGALFLLK